MLLPLQARHVKASLAVRAGDHLALVAVVLTLLQRLPTGLHAPRPTPGGSSSLWAGVPTVGGEADPDAAALRKALLSVLRRVLAHLAMAGHRHYGGSRWCRHLRVRW